ncbi:hypothetical protein M407DRAFT_20654 [Tulasnella calospora MUT 4182]|uniref:F-box domain-containing protein n=1 Tax=Tulasnella calospora MUT 4182 TaxID=1051891 RepID=A0A0C3QPH0_9AGAM|nr:hypothetical protein M407DRAFT_20654 [Tulasnella calospora MUT 4182]
MTTQTGGYRAKISRPSAPRPPELSEQNVPPNPLNTPPSVCCIERLQPELLEAIFLSLIGLGDGDHAQNRNLVKRLVLVCRRWSAVASRLALVNIKIKSQRSADLVIKHAHRLSKGQGGWAPTRVLYIWHLEAGSFHRLAELIGLFGRTLYKLELHGSRNKWNQPYAEGSFPPTIQGQVYFPMLRTLTMWGVSSATVKECLRNIDPTKLEDMGLGVARALNPADGYLNGQVFPRLEKLKLGRILFDGEASWEDMKTTTPALKSLPAAPISWNR